MADIFFRAFEISDAEFINSLRKIDEFENLIGGNKRFVSLARDRKWVEDLIYNDYQDRIYVAICEKQIQNIIGYASVCDIDHLNKACSWGGIKIHPDFHGKGYGKLTALLLVKFVFEELNIERYEAQCLEEHVVSKKMMEKVGFVTEGLRRNSIFKNGKYHNQLVFSLLKSEYPVIKEQYKL